jgi:hypothetical protein
VNWGHCWRTLMQQWLPVHFPAPSQLGTSPSNAHYDCSQPGLEPWGINTQACLLQGAFALTAPGALPPPPRLPAHPLWKYATPRASPGGGWGESSGLHSEGPYPRGYYTKVCPRGLFFLHGDSSPFGLTHCGALPTRLEPGSFQESLWIRYK